MLWKNLGFVGTQLYHFLFSGKTEALTFSATNRSRHRGLRVGDHKGAESLRELQCDTPMCNYQIKL